MRARGMVVMVFSIKWMALMVVSIVVGLVALHGWAKWAQVSVCSASFLLHAFALWRLRWEDRMRNAGSLRKLPDKG